MQVRDHWAYALCTLHQLRLIPPGPPRIPSAPPPVHVLCQHLSPTVP